jgi:NifU-like protein involved in Fe-S cluster formation
VSLEAAVDPDGSGAAERSHRAAAYGPLVREHFERPRNQHAMPDATATALVHNPVCGDRLCLYLRVHADRIVAASFQAQGCPATIAASSVGTELLVGKSTHEALLLTREQVAEALGGLPRSKVHCSVLVEQAVAVALRTQ